MGVYDAPDTANYWNTDIKNGPLHTIPNYMGLKRWQQIKRYLHISCPYTDESTGLNKPNNKIWWYKVEPLASNLRANFR